jgi:carbonic anhydrase/acetyltransferase-like protein (isoleucine patch superfamily)
MPIRAFNEVQPTLGARVYVDPAALAIGRVTLGDDASLWPMAVARGDVNTIAIGARTNVQDGTVIHVDHDGPYTPGGVPAVIGADVTIGHQFLIHACTIGDRCLIGMGAIVMDGAAIEDDVLLAAGSLVSPGKRLQSGFIYRGRPARQMRKLSAEDLDRLKYSAAHYVRLKETYLQTR